MKQMRWIVCAMLAAVGSCSQGVSVDNGNPSGTVAGIIVDATSEAPLMGATVTVVAGDKTQTAMTDMNGQFAVGKVPAGTFIMTVVQMGYVSAQLTDTLAGSVGNFPVNDPQRTIGPVGLFPASGSFTVHVVDEAGAPVPSLKLIAHTGVRQVVYSNGAPFGEGAFEVSATTGMDGSAMFTGLPMLGALGYLGGVVDDSFTVVVPPTKIMGTEIYDFLGGSFGFHLNGLASSAQVIHLAGPNTPLVILDSNIEYLRNRSNGTPTTFNAPVGSVIPINGPITVAFNQAIDPSSLRTEFLDGDGKLMATMAMATVNLNQVTITPSVPLAAGKRFNLIIHAVAATTAGTLGGGGAGGRDGAVLLAAAGGRADHGGGELGDDDPAGRRHRQRDRAVRALGADRHRQRQQRRPRLRRVLRESAAWACPASTTTTRRCSRATGRRSAPRTRRRRTSSAVRPSAPAWPARPRST